MNYRDMGMILVDDHGNAVEKPDLSKYQDGSKIPAPKFNSGLLDWLPEDVRKQIEPEITYPDLDSVMLTTKGLQILMEFSTSKRGMVVTKRNRPTLKLCMENEFKFNVNELGLRSIVEEMMERHPEEMKACPEHDRYAYARLLVRAENFMDVMRMVDIEDCSPEIEYTVGQMANYMNERYASYSERLDRGLRVEIDGKVLHPRHWVYEKVNGEFHFLNYKLLGRGVKIEYFINKPKEKLPGYIDSIPPGIRVVSTGMALGSGLYEEMPKQAQGDINDIGRVKGNGRQKLVTNGKRTWPGAKVKKGHRRG